MRKLTFFTILSTLLIFSSCQEKQTAPAATQNQFSVELTDQEKAGGVMTPEIMWKFTRLGSFVLSPDGSEVVYAVTKTDLPTENRITNIFKVPAAGGKSVQLTTGGGSSPQWISDGKRIIFVKKGSLCTMNSDGTGQKEVTGLSEFESFSVSPAGDKIYFTRKVKLDQTANEKHGMPNAKVRIINDLMYRHWNYWSDYSYSHIFVASFDGNTVSGERDIMAGQKFESPTAPDFDDAEISWSPNGKSIAYTSKRLNGKADAISTNSDIFLYDLESGKELNISEGNKGYDKYPVFSPDGSMISYQSMERDGYESDLNRLFIYTIKDGKGEWLNKGWDFDVENVNWLDNSVLYFSSAHLGTTHIFKTDLQSKEVTKITAGEYGFGPLNLKSGVMITGLATFSMANEIAAVDLKTGEVKLITSLNKYIYDNIKMGKAESKVIRTKDNMDLQMWVIYPPDFDPSKKYPLLLFCKGGPQGPPAIWSYRWNFQMMAAKGYIVVAPSRRGTSGFGQAWKEQISGDYGGKNIQDYLDATDAMAKEPYVDKNRMGAVGASYGGFSVFYLAGMHEGRFKVFVSHAGVFNFESEYGATEELWFPNFDYGGPYWENHKSYKFSPHLMVKNWDTPILIIQGKNDFRIPYTQALEAFTAAQVRGVPSRLLIFEDEYHWVMKPQNAVIWQREYFEWLDTYLK